MPVAAPAAATPVDRARRRPGPAARSTSPCCASSGSSRRRSRSSAAGWWGCRAANCGFGAEVDTLANYLPLLVAELPDGPPALLRWGGMAHRVRQAEGPLRLEAEWWRTGADAPPRDYYRVELASGARLWVYRAGMEWRLHGHLP